MKSVVSSFTKKPKYNTQFDYDKFYYFNFSSAFLTKLISKGCKIRSFNFMIALFYELKLRTQVSPFWVILIAMYNLMPDIILFPKKLGGTSKYVPLPITESKQISIATKWLVKAYLSSKVQKSPVVFADLLVSTALNEGLACEMKESYYQKGLPNAYLVKYFR